MVRLSTWTLLGLGFLMACPNVCWQSPQAARLDDAPANLGRSANDGRIITFTGDVAPIIYAHCIVCHRPGNIGPFPLTNYQDVRQRAKLIGLVTQHHIMPPWKAEIGYGRFQGVRRLSDRDAETILRWVEQGAPEGNPKDLRPAPRLPDGWHLGQPDIILEMPKPFTVPANGEDFYRCFIIPTQLARDAYISAFEDRPSDRRVVHHSIIVEDAFRAGTKLETEPGGGYPCYGGFGFSGARFFGFWTAGMVPKFFPPGTAARLGKSSDLIVQVHFHPTHEVVQERIAIGLYLAPDRPLRVAQDFAVTDDDIDIPPGAEDFKVRTFAYVPGDVEALNVFAHAHFLATRMQASATLPDGSVKPLLRIVDWDPDWQEQYWFASPVYLPQGTRVDMEFTFDNSAHNPHNPNHPPKRVTWGFRAVDEMAEIHLETVPASPIVTEHQHETRHH
jgi:hypothetical protein